MKQTFICIEFNEQVYKMDFTLHPKGSVPIHFHEHMDESFNVIEGEGTFKIDGKNVIATQGQQIFVPKGVHHSIKNNTSTPFRCIVTYSPCSDTHRMFAIFTDLYSKGYREGKLMLKGEWICRAAGLKVFSRSPGFLNTIEKGVMTLLTPIAHLKGWDNESIKYK